MTQHFRQFNGFVGVDNLRLPPAVIPAQAGIQRFDVAAILKHSCNIRDWIPACAGMTALCVLFELLSDRPSEKSRSDTRIRQPRLTEMSDSRIRPALLIMSFIGRLKMTKQISWLLHYFQTASILF